MQKAKKDQNSLKKWFEKDLDLTKTAFCADEQSVSIELLRLLCAFRKSGVQKNLVAVPSFADAEQLCREMDMWAQALGITLETMLVPEGSWKGNLTPEDEAPRAEILAQALSEDSPAVFVGSVHALLAPVPARSLFHGSELSIRLGDRMEIGDLARKLVEMGYDDEPEASAVGEFSKRGGIFDIFSPGMENPVRLEFFGSEIDSMREYSPQTGRSIREIQSCRVLMRSGSVLPLENEVFENFSAYVPERRLVIWKPEECVRSLEKFGDEASPDRWDEFRNAYESPVRILTELEAAEENLHIERDCAGIVPQLRSAAEMSAKTMIELSRELSREFVKQLIAEKNTVIFAAGRDSDRAHITEWLCTNHLRDSRNISISPLTIPCGIQLPELKTVYLTERELFSTVFREKTPRRAAVVKEELPQEIERREYEHMADIEEGDFVVHLNYGLCLYRGIREIKSGAENMEALELEFADDAVICIPVWQAHLLSRYVGSRAGVTKLSKLGGTRWLKNRLEAAAAAHNLAAEMLRMQVIRKSSNGIAFQPDGMEQRIFEDAFPYEATAGQLRAADEIKKDMESVKPMDRLLCGDVGYGKTEVAMRAAFKCISSGRQVAVLVPTTVLAEQHFLSFSERFAEYPFVIETLSRLRTGKERASILERLATGGVDVLIGTHAILGRDVHFKNLGLLIIDEEQRFGVEDKEHLKAVRSTVDILTMTATPIPRTLHMSISGLRDLSTITTAPTRRLPVHTIVMQDDSSLIGAALAREIGRGGQVFYLHNRVKTLERAAARVKSLVPENVVVEYAHGQMSPARLERIMNDFIAGKIQVLVSTTIIESGIDIPNANTIIIERADHFGLAELHQLRGRVGRWNRQAYAYMLIPPAEVMTSDARRRMSVIRRYSQLGSGFKLALSDLEIRGAGNIIGAEQSGYVDAIGFHLYCQLLKEASNSLRGITNPKLVSVELNLDFLTFAVTAKAGRIPAGIPPEYIEEPRLRLGAYRRLALMTELAELEDYAAELKDRFGTIPPAAENFLKTVRLRILIQKAGWSSLSCRDGKIFLERHGEVYRRNGLVPKLPGVFPPQERLDMLLYFAKEVLQESGK